MYCRTRCNSEAEASVAVANHIIPATEPPHMDLSGDELAGVVELFGGLTRGELGDGLAELAFKRGEEYEPDAFADDIESAVEEYYLVPLDPGDVDGVDAPVLVAGPSAFPELPEGAEDLLHILDAEERAIDRETAGERAAERFRVDAAQALDDGAEDRIATLVDISYELEAWGGVDLADVRERLD